MKNNHKIFIAIAIVSLCVALPMLHNLQHKRLCHRLALNLDRCYYNTNYENYDKRNIDYDTNLYLRTQLPKDLEKLRKNEESFLDFGSHNAYETYYSCYETLYKRFNKRKNF